MNTQLTFDDIGIGRKQRLERTVTAADVDAFGRLCGDLNPLHMDEEFAKRTPFKQRVVHGLFTGALVSTTHTQLTGPGFAYVGQELKFLGPVFIGDKLSVEVTVVGKKDAKRILILDTVVSKQGGDKVLAGLSALKELRIT
jgi:acyl dehydratase